MIENPVKVPENKITSLDISRFGGGLYTEGEENAPRDAFISSKNMELDYEGFLQTRSVLRPFLPDTENKSHQRYPVYWDGKMYYFILDGDTAKYCEEGDSSWTDCDGDNEFSTGDGIPKLARVKNKIVVVNGQNGDKLAFIDLETSGFPVEKYDPITDPASKVTFTRSNLTAGGFNVYYSYAYTNEMGTTKLAPIETVDVNHSRDEWLGLDSQGSVKVTRPGSAPSGAKYWNLYISLAASGGSITDDDMLLLQSKIDINQTDVIDDGSIPINTSSTAPIVNSTDGFKATQIEVANDQTICYGDPDHPYNIYISGAGPYSLDFSINNGGSTIESQKGTNYYPTRVVGFRNGQGIPSLTVLYTNTEGLSKQTLLEQNTISLGDASIVVWGAKEQNYGAAGVASPDSAINYKGRLIYLSVDGFMSMETSPSIQNVLDVKRISSPVDSMVNTIKVSAMKRVVGTGWGNKYMWTVPVGGFDDPQKILVLDVDQKGTDGNGAWYALDLKAHWIDVVTPQDKPAFVYVVIGAKSYYLAEKQLTYDKVGGENQQFETEVTSGLMALGETQNVWWTIYQVVIHLTDFAGVADVLINYKNKEGRIKTRRRRFFGTESTPSVSGGWGDPQWQYANFPLLPGWSAFPEIEDSNSQKLTSKRFFVPISDTTNAIQYSVSTQKGYNRLKIRSVSVEGENLGIRPDLR